MSYGTATYGVDPWGGAYVLGAAHLLYILRMAPRWRALSDIIDARYSRVQGIVERIRTAFDLDSAVGEQLDFIGEWIGRRREGMSDARYRRALRVQVFLLSSNSGSASNVREVWAAWTGALPTSYRSVAPVFFEIEGVVAPEDEALLLQFIAASLPAGVPFEIFGFESAALIADSISDSVSDPGVADSVADPVPAARVVGYAIA